MHRIYKVLLALSLVLGMAPSVHNARAGEGVIFLTKEEALAQKEKVKALRVENRDLRKRVQQAEATAAAATQRNKTLQAAAESLWTAFDETTKNNLRVWQSREGSKLIAKMGVITEDSIELIKPKGSPIVIKLERLSKADQAYVEQVRQARPLEETIMAVEEPDQGPPTIGAVEIIRVPVEEE